MKSTILRGAMILDHDGQWIGSVLSESDNGRYFVLNDVGAHWRIGQTTTGHTPANEVGRTACTFFSTKRAAAIAFRKAYFAEVTS